MDIDECILVSTHVGQDEVLNSKVALQALMDKINAARQVDEPIQIKVDSGWMAQV